MAWSLALLAALGLVASQRPVMPTQYSSVMVMRMSYLGLEMPIRVETSSTGQKIEYYNGLEVDLSSANGTHKFVFNNGKRDCLYTPPSAGPTYATTFETKAGLRDSAWAPMAFLPDLTDYTQAGQELIGGIMCQKFTLDKSHGSKGTMDDHISFYWDPVLGKPVRWHMHSRHVSFGSHTDEYVMDYLSFQNGAPRDADMALPELCTRPRLADVSIQLRHFLSIAQAASRRQSSAQDTDSDFLFDAFVKQHGKSYRAEEYAARRKIFARNVHLVAALNKRHSGSAKFKGNQFLDMTKDEVLRFRGGKRSGSSRKERRSEEHRSLVTEFVPNHKFEIPKAFDWRSSRPGVVGPVKDQAMCGSCWAYGLLGPVESIHAVQTGKLVELPEQFVVDCTWTNGTGDSGGNLGCDGGDSDIGALEIVRKFGGVIPSAAAYGSYMSINGYCKDVRLMEVGAKITGWQDIKERDEQALLQALVQNGPISVGIMVPDEMLFYDSGVLQVDSCKHNKTQIDHAVVLVGFGTDEHGTDYYVIRNSWSTYWGDEGYIKISRGERDCCVSSEAGFPTLATALQNTLVV